MINVYRKRDCSLGVYDIVHCIQETVIARTDTNERLRHNRSCWIWMRVIIYVHKADSHWRAKKRLMPCLFYKGVNRSNMAIPLQNSFRTDHLPFSSFNSPAGHRTSPCQRLKRTFCFMMVIGSANNIHMQGHPCLGSPAVQTMIDHLRFQLANR